MFCLWLCTNQSGILFIIRHFVAYHDELFQHHFLFFPLKFPKFLAVAE